MQCSLCWSSVALMSLASTCLCNSTRPFKLICPNHLCHKSVVEGLCSEMTFSPVIVTPWRMYKPWFKVSLMATMIPLRTPHRSFISYPLVSRVPRYIKFILSSAMYHTSFRIFMVPSTIFNLTNLMPLTSHVVLSPIKTLLPSVSSRSNN